MIDSVSEGHLELALRGRQVVKMLPFLLPLLFVVRWESIKRVLLLLLLLLLQEGHLCLTASQGSFPWNFFFAVATNDRLGRSLYCEEGSLMQWTLFGRRKWPSWRRGDRSGLLFLKRKSLGVSGGSVAHRDRGSLPVQINLGKSYSFFHFFGCMHIENR